MQTVAECLAKARALSEEAEACADVRARAKLLQLADGWLALSEIAERHQAASAGYCDLILQIARLLR